MSLLIITGIVLFVGTMVYAHIIGAQDITQLTDHLVSHFWQTQVLFIILLVTGVLLRLGTKALFPANRQVQGEQKRGN